MDISKTAIIYIHCKFYKGRFKTVNNMSDVKQMYLDLLKASLCGTHFEESSYKPTDISECSIKEIFLNPVQGFKNWFCAKMLKRFVVPPLMLYTRHPYDQKAREEGSDWPYLAYTMIGFRRMENIQFCIEEVIRNNVPGDLIETGAWRGGAAIYMRGIFKVHEITNRNVYLADSFEDLPKPLDESDGWDLSECDYLKVSLDQVIEPRQQNLCEQGGSARSPRL